MNRDERFLGFVQVGRFVIVSPASSVAAPTRLTRIAMNKSVPPESQEIDLSEYEDKTLMVSGTNGGGWIYSASIVDQGGPIMAALMREVFKVQA